MAKNTDPNSQSYKASSSSSIRVFTFFVAFFFLIFFSHYFLFFHCLFKMKNEHTFRLLSLVNKRLQCGTSKTLKAYSESAVSPLPTRGLVGGLARWAPPPYTGWAGLASPSCGYSPLHCRAQRSLVLKQNWCNTF